MTGNRYAILHIEKRVQMIYSIQCTGQMCNRILWFVHTLATAMDLKTDIIHPFGREIRSFSDLHPEVIPEIKVRCFNWRRCMPVDVLHGWLQRLPSFGQRYLDGNAARCEKWIAERRKNLLLWNWHFRNSEAIARHHDKIVAFLRAKDMHCVRPNKIVDSLRKDGAIVVGVHLRRGDYKEMMPQWYFDDATYLRMMREFESSIGRRVKFAMVSNEPINVAYFRENGQDVMDASGSPQEDIVTLSLCDYIMGPASTFSWWAAYYGNKPRLSLRSRDDHVVVGKFIKEGSFFERPPVK